jgi:urea transport system permease protein
VTFRIPFTLLLLATLALAPLSASQGADISPERATLIKALLDEGDQIELVNSLVASTDPLVERGLAGWRVSEVFLHKTESGDQIPCVLDKEGDAENRVQATRLDTGEPLLDAAGVPLRFLADQIEAVDTTSKLRKAIKSTLDLMRLANPDPNFRRDAATKLAFEQNQDYLAAFRTTLERESDPMVQRALAEAIAITQLAAADTAAKQEGIVALGNLQTIGAIDLLVKIAQDETSAPKTADLARASIKQIEDHIFWVNTSGTAFRGLSLAAVLLVAALGLAITFGLMGVINMAHGEMIMIGAYATYVTSNVFTRFFGESGPTHDLYFIAALPVSFLVAGGVGLILERTVIQFLYKRPLESLLATWGVSLILQQTVRTMFGAANVQLYSPSWLSGNFTVHDVLFAYNRIFVIGFAVFIVCATWLLMTRTPLGLQIRAVMQNRQMAACMGVRTNRVNMLTFAFGSGLAGVAGACLSQIGNVGPSLGQSHVIDCFMVVVLGGVGNIIGTVSAALGIGVIDQILQPWLGAVMGKIIVLTGIILFLQWRPAGLFVTRSRSLEG